MLLDAIQELRAAGAEAIQVNGVRVSRTPTSRTPAASIEVDGKRSPRPTVSRSSASRRTWSRR